MLLSSVPLGIFTWYKYWLQVRRHSDIIFSQLHPPHLINEHKHPFGIKNPKFQCFFNSDLQLIFSIFRNNSYTSPFNSSTEGTLLKCLFQTVHNAHNSKDVDALKFQLVHHNTFHNGQNQQDSTECLLMLIKIIHKGSMPDSSSTTYSMGASLSGILFSFVLEKQGKSEGFDSCDRPIDLKLDSNRQFFRPCDREIWSWMTSKNNRALLYYVKLCASFQIHWWIQTGFTVQKRSIRVEIGDMLSCVTLNLMDDLGKQ